MSTPPRNLPRFLPTLTEVVQPSSLTRTAPEVARPDSEKIIETVMQRLDLVIEQRLREEIDAMFGWLVTEQVKIIAARLHDELDVLVRQAVAEAMASQGNQDELK